MSRRLKVTPKSLALVGLILAATSAASSGCGGGSTEPANAETTRANDTTGNSVKPERKPAQLENNLLKELEALPASVRAVEYPERLDFKDEHLQVIATKPDIALLDLTGCSAISDNQFAILAALKNLRILRLARTSIGDEALAHLAPVTSLEVLDIAYNDEVTDHGVSELAGLLRLEELNLEGCDAITDRSLESVANLKALRRLSLAYCPKISVAGIATVLKGCPTLEELILHHTPFGDDLADALGDGYALKRVDVRACPTLSVAGKASLVSKFASIEFVTDP